MSATLAVRPRPRTAAQELARRLGEALTAWAERPTGGGVDVERLAQVEERRADARFAEPFGLHHWLR